MTLRKILIDNSVRYIPKTEKTNEKEIKPKTTKNKKNESISGGGKQNKKFSKNNKNFVKDFTAGGFAILK